MVRSRFVHGCQHDTERGCLAVDEGMNILRIFYVYIYDYMTSKISTLRLSYFDTIFTFVLE